MHDTGLVRPTREAMAWRFVWLLRCYLMDEISQEDEEELWTSLGNPMVEDESSTFHRWSERAALAHHKGAFSILFRPSLIQLPRSRCGFLYASAG